MVEQVGHLDIGSAAVALTDILVMCLVFCTAQVKMNKIENHQPLTFCERREQLEKRLNSLQRKGRQVFCCVHFLFLI